MKVYPERASLHAFDVGFRSRSTDDQSVNRLLSGNLHLTPHPNYQYGESINWDADPFNERNWRVQLHMLRWLDPVRRIAEISTGHRRETTTKFWIETVESWAHHSADPSSASDDAWLDMTDAMRLKTLCFGIPMVEKCASDALEPLIKLIKLHCGWIRDEQNLGHSNHALHQHVALFIAARVLDDHELQTLATERLIALFASQYDEQGLNAEGALVYHQLNYVWWKDAIKHFEVEDFEIPAIFNLLKRVPEELAHATAPTGNLAVIGDSDRRPPTSVAHPNTKYVVSKGAEGIPPKGTVKLYDGGYLFARSGWGQHERKFSDETFVAIPFGSNRKVHGHVDGGSISFTSLGVDWVVDPGKFAYNSSDFRRYFVSREAHSLVSIRGKTYDSTKPVKLAAFSDSHDSVDARLIDSGYPDVRIQRRIVFSKAGEYLVVVDTIKSKTDVVADQCWQLDSHVDASITRRGFDLCSGDIKASLHYTGTNAQISIIRGKEKPLRGWVSPEWKVASPANQALFTKSGSHFRFVTVLAAGYKGTQPTFKAEDSGIPGALQLVIDTGRIRERIRIDSGEVTFPDNQFPVDAPVRWPRAPETAKYADPVNIEQRQFILDNLNEIRSRAWDVQAPSNLDLAEQIADTFTDLTPYSGFDLGIRATLSDLTRPVSSAPTESTPAKWRWGFLNFVEGEPSFAPSFPGIPIYSFKGVKADGDLFGGSCESILSFDLGATTLIAALANIEGDTLTVMFHGALDRHRTQLPMFQRFRHQREISRGPVLAFSDATLDYSDRIRLGWYLGNERMDLASKMAQIIRRVARQLCVEHVVLNGSSGGGFAALQVGAFLPEAHVVAMNPQIDLRNYFEDYANAGSETAFGYPIKDLPDKYLPRVSVSNRYEALDSTMKCTFVLNDGDIHHLKNHVEPLLEQAKTRHSGWQIRRIDMSLGPGHVTLNNDLYTEVLNDVYDYLGSKPGSTN